MDNDREKNGESKRIMGNVQKTLKRVAEKAFVLVGDSYRHRYSRPFSR